MKKGKDEPQHEKDASHESASNDSSPENQEEDNADQHQTTQSNSSNSSAGLSAQLARSQQNEHNSNTHRQSHSTRRGIRVIHDPDEMHCGKIRPTSSRDDSFTTASMTSLSFTTNSFGHSSRRSSPRRPSRNLYNAQLQLLATMTGGSFIAFLFFFLNIFAFVSFMMGLVSVFMLMHTIYNYGNFLIESGEGAFFDFLPQSLQDYLTHTTIHDAMIDDSEFMENRWYLLYFIPGLTNEQRQILIDRLPQRHRDMAYGPGGLARLFLPDSLFRMIAPPNARSTAMVNVNHNHPSIAAVSSRGEEGSSDGNRWNRNTIGNDDTNRLVQLLPMIEEGNDEESNQTEEDQVTIQDALHNVIYTARSWITGTRPDIPRDMGRMIQGPIHNMNDLTMNNSTNNDEDEQANFNSALEVNILNDDDNHSDLGIDLDPNDMTGGMNDGQLRRLARFVGFSSPQPMNPSTPNMIPATPSSPETPFSPIRLRVIETSSTPVNTIHASNVSSTAFERALNALDENSSNDGEIGSVAEQTLEEQQELEGDIITVGLEWMVNHYTNQASDTILSLTSNIIEGIAPSIIRFGSRLSGISAIGLIGIYTSTLQQPFQIMGRSIVGGRHARTRTEERISAGFTLTLALGAISAGSAYAVRNLLRGMMSATTKTKNDKLKK